MMRAPGRSRSTSAELPHRSWRVSAQRFPDTADEAQAEGHAAPRRAGRPKLGVVGREVTLLPRHWDWLAEQPGGASVAIRRLIDSERKSSEFKILARKAQEITYRFMHAIAGNFPHFEDASRALFAGDRETFARNTEDWPADIRDHARWLMIGGAQARRGAELKHEERIRAEIRRMPEVLV